MKHYFSWLTSAATPISIKGIASIAAACVGAICVVAILGTLVSAFSTLIDFYKKKHGDAESIFVKFLAYQHSHGCLDSIDTRPYSCKCRTQ